MADKAMLTVDNLGKTPEEFAIILKKEVAAGTLSNEEAEVMLNAFTQVKVPSSPARAAVSIPVINDENIPVTTLSPMPSASEQTFLQKLAAGEVEDTDLDYLKTAIDVANTDPRGMSSDKLAAMENDAAAIAELASRNQIQEQTFLERLQNPDYLHRMAVAPAKSVPQMANALTGLGPLAGMGIEKLTGADLGAQEAMMQTANRHQALNETFGTGDALTTDESVMENLMGLGAPTMALKATAVGSDFLTDQIMREVTEQPQEKYETVFDKIGLTSQRDKPLIADPLLAAGIGTVFGVMSTKGLNMMKNKISTSPLEIRPIREIDATGPAELMTIERASDLTKANVLDEQRALKDILRRAGVPDITDVENRIEFDTHAAIRTRANEALAVGEMNLNGAQFKVDVAPKTLYNAYSQLDDVVKTDVAKYINLLDMTDDIRLAITKKPDPAMQQHLYNLVTEATDIANRQPIVKQFKGDFDAITSATRNFLEGSLFSSKFKQYLDKTRPNYVPLEISDVDVNAPLMQRLSQAQASGGRYKDDWFLEERESIGTYDVTKRADPMDMMMQSVEAAIISRGKNDTKLSIIDGLLNSEVGKQTIRKAKGDDVSRYGDRVISVYRNGEKENYITSKLTTELTKFDPYVAKFPMLFMPKRLAEQAMVGPLSITFAPVTAIRDTIGGAVLRPEGLLAANPLEVAAAVPRQLWAKAQSSLSEHIKSSFLAGETPFPEWLMDVKGQQALADKMSNSYLGSIYHVANSKGGFDASQMKNKIEYGKSAFAEVKRTLREGLKNKPLVNNVVTRFGVDRVENMIDGFVALFNSIQDAPRFAAIKKTVDAGGDVAESTHLARKLTGDVTKSGRVYNSSGERYGVDAVDQGALNFANKYIGIGTELARESVPFVNPAIQGMRNLAQSFANDPVGTNIRAWTYVGLPALAAYGWNEMQGQEYNDYAMNQRAASDVAMNMYIAIPGLPPEQGLEIPIVHELLGFNAPFTRGLHGLTRGEKAAELQGAMSVVAETILKNSVDVGFPTAGAAIMNLLGQEAPDGLFTGGNAYTIKEDNIGLLPENMEKLARTLFANVGQTAIELATAMSGDFSFETMQQTLYNNVVKRAPIVKNLTGNKSTAVSFSIPAEYNREKWDATEEFRTYWDNFYNPKRINEDGIDKPASKDGYTGAKDLLKEKDDLPFTMIGPDQMREPTNPLYKIVGDTLVTKIQQNEIGMSGVVDRDRTYSKIASRIKKFNAGDKELLQDWQATLHGIKAPSEETKKLQELLDELDLDLGKYDDRVKLLNHIEAERSHLIQTQLDVFAEVEKEVTMLLRKKKILEPDQEFIVEKHLQPFNSNPFGGSPN